jgi:hypothetical protein
MLSKFFRMTDKMRIIHAGYDMYHNSIDIATYAGLSCGLIAAWQRKG